MSLFLANFDKDQLISSLQEEDPEKLHQKASEFILNIEEAEALADEHPEEAAQLLSLIISGAALLEARAAYLKIRKLASMLP